MRTTLSVGAYEVYVFHDGIYTAPIADLLHSRGEVERDRAIARWGKPDFSVDVNCFGLHGPDGLVLIDAGAGTFWGPAYGKAEASIRQAGFTPEQVSTVLLTHNHGDHALGLFDAEKRPRYPNADIRLPRGEFVDYGNKNAVRTLAWMKDAYGVQLTPLDFGPVLPGIDAVALPGHTPGHTGYLIHDDRKSLLISGDIVHLEALQLADPDIGFDYDADFSDALHSRRTALEKVEREGWHIAGGHITGIRRLRRDGSGFAFVEE
jgi:glyoxylase-like metal-dependent hydrolase (beta-lactamase superfamily II)